MKFKHVYLTLLLSLISLTSVSAQRLKDQMVTKYLVILYASTHFDSTQLIANQCANKMKIETELNVKPHKETGLTFSEKECEEGGFDYPCYVARGRGEDKEYLSIEYSSDYKGFKEGYYILVGFHGTEKKQAELSLKKFKAFYPDAYIKKTQIYIGCIH